MDTSSTSSSTTMSTSGQMRTEDLLRIDPAFRWRSSRPSLKLSAQIGLESGCLPSITSRTPRILIQ